MSDVVSELRALLAEYEAVDAERYFAREERWDVKKRILELVFPILPALLDVARERDEARAEAERLREALRAWVPFLALERAEKERDDPDYSPAYQDEYQRLWHEAAAERDRLREALRWKPTLDRCSSCAHPLAEGEWTGCDAECRHGGGFRCGEHLMPDAWMSAGEHVTGCGPDVQARGRAHAEERACPECAGYGLVPRNKKPMVTTLFDPCPRCASGGERKGSGRVRPLLCQACEVTP